MELNQIMAYILDAIPHPIVFVDCDHIIRYMNKRAKYHYYEERGYRNLIGCSLFDCHHENSRKTIETIIERLKKHGQEEFHRVNVRNERIYIAPVRDEHGQLVGYFERFERNFTRS